MVGRLGGTTGRKSASASSSFVTLETSGAEEVRLARAADTPLVAVLVSSVAIGVVTIAVVAVVDSVRAALLGETMPRFRDSTTSINCVSISSAEENAGMTASSLEALEYNSQSFSSSSSGARSRAACVVRVGACVGGDS